MDTVVAPEVVEEGPEPSGAPESRARIVGRAIAGPLCIVAGVAFALRGFAFRPLLTNQHPDILAFWLPRFSFLGRSIAAGHVPLWNPFEMTGQRYAADPQGGWLYLVPMALFSMLSAGAAMRALIVFNPMLAGLGLYVFLRREGLSRPAATAGGLAVALPMSTSIIAVAMPFAGAIAWTTVVLIAAGGFRRAPTGARRLAWLGLAAFGWSQVATAHLSHGLAMSTLLVATYLGVWAIGAVRAGELSRARAARLFLGFFAFLPLASLAIVIPRLNMIASSSLHGGYAALAQERVAGVQDLAIMANGVWSAWPLAIATAPGAYVGAVTILAIPLALRSRRHRSLVLAFGGAALLVYLLTLNVLVTAGWFRTIVLKIPYGDVYLHNPGRLRYVWTVAAPVLAAVGIQGLIDRPPTRRTLLRWFAGTVALFVAVPLVFGGHPVRYVPLAIGLAAAVPAALRVVQGRRWAPVVLVAVLAAELIGSAVYSQVYQGGTIYTGLESGENPNIVPQVLRWPNVPEQQFLQPTDFVKRLAGTQDRYLTWVRPAAYFDKGYLFAQQPRDWPALAMERGTLFGIHDVLGYNPVQNVRYWSFIRAADPLSVFYNAAVVKEPTPSLVRLLGVRYVIQPVGQGLPATLPGHAVATADGYRLMEIDGWEPRVSVVSDWTVTSGPLAALTSVVDPSFDPGRTAIVERDLGVQPQPGAVPGSATYDETSPEQVHIVADATAPSIVVIRNNWDAGWSATVDGRPAPVVPTDGFRQGVVVSAGHHVVELTYRDPSIGRGLAASAVVWSGWGLALGGAVILRRRRVRARA